MVEKSMAAQDGKRPPITNDSELPRKEIDPAGHAPEVLESNVAHTSVDMEEKPMAARDCKTPNITNDSELPRKDIDPAGEESESDQRKNVSTMEHSTGPSGGYVPEVLQSNVDHTNVDLEEKPMAAQAGKTPSITNDSELSRKDIDPAVKVYVLVTGEIFNTHETFIQKLKLQIKFCSAESSNVILLFCPVVSHVRTDMEAAMARVTEDKPVILVFMHHCHNPSHMTNITVQPSSSKIAKIIHCAYHESQGLLECIQNEQAVAEVCSMLLKYRRIAGGERIKINSVRPFSYTRF